MPKEPKFKNNPLRLIRKALKYTQPEFARLIGLSESYVQKVELGDEVLSEQVAVRMGLQFGFRPSSLRRQRGSPKPLRERKSSLAEQIDDWQGMLEIPTTTCLQQLEQVLFPKIRLLVKAALAQGTVPGTKRRGKGPLAVMLIDDAIHTIVRDLDLENRVSEIARKEDILIEPLIEMIEDGAEIDMIL
jgi:transcriptional regulator with XRE-family HTH domain